MCLCSFCLCEFRKILRKFRTRPIELGVYQAWNIKKAWNIKGIVSRNWGRMQMVLLDRFEVCKIPLNFYFKFKFHFKLDFFSKWHLSEYALALDFL
jgi:hypothetical protein